MRAFDAPELDHQGHGRFKMASEAARLGCGKLYAGSGEAPSLFTRHADRTLSYIDADAPSLCWVPVLTIVTVPTPEIAALVPALSGHIVQALLLSRHALGGSIC
jgi:hypothetical protein